MRFLPISLLALCVSAGQALPQTSLINGDFEAGGDTGFGNALSAHIEGWEAAAPFQDFLYWNSANLAQVDGPGGLSYGGMGPESDANGLPAGAPQHYVDDVPGNMRLWQYFTPDCAQTLQATASFSTRHNHGDVEVGLSLVGPLSTRIAPPRRGEAVFVQGSDLTNFIALRDAHDAVATPQLLPGGSSETYEWVSLSSNPLAVQPGQDYAVVIAIGPNGNVDDVELHTIGEVGRCEIRVEAQPNVQISTLPNDGDASTPLPLAGGAQSISLTKSCTPLEPMEMNGQQGQLWQCEVQASVPTAPFVGVVTVEDSFVSSAPVNAQVIASSSASGNFDCSAGASCQIDGTNWDASGTETLNFDLFVTSTEVAGSYLFQNCAGGTLVDGGAAPEPLTQSCVPASWMPSIDVVKTCDPIAPDATAPFTLDCQITVTGNDLPSGSYVSLIDAFAAMPPAMAPVQGGMTNVTSTEPWNCVDVAANPGVTMGHCALSAADLQNAGGNSTLNMSLEFTPDQLPTQVANCPIIDISASAPASAGSGQRMANPGQGSGVFPQSVAASGWPQGMPDGCVFVDVPEPDTGTGGGSPGPKLEDIDVTKTCEAPRLELRNGVYGYLWECEIGIEVTPAPFAGTFTLTEDASSLTNGSASFLSASVPCTGLSTNQLSCALDGTTLSSATTVSVELFAVPADWSQPLEWENCASGLAETVSDTLQTERACVPATIKPEGEPSYPDPEFDISKTCTLGERIPTESFGWVRPVTWNQEVTCEITVTSVNGIAFTGPIWVGEELLYGPYDTSGNITSMTSSDPWQCVLASSPQSTANFCGIQGSDFPYSNGSSTIEVTLLMQGPAAEEHGVTNCVGLTLGGVAPAMPSSAADASDCVEILPGPNDDDDFGSIILQDVDSVVPTLPNFEGGDTPPDPDVPLEPFLDSVTVLNEHPTPDLPDPDLPGGTTGGGVVLGDSEDVALLGDVPTPVEPWFRVEKTCEPLVYAAGASSAMARCYITVSGWGLTAADTLRVSDNTFYHYGLPLIGTFMNIQNAPGWTCHNLGYSGYCVSTGDVLMAAGGSMTFIWTAEFGHWPYIPAGGVQNCAIPRLNYHQGPSVCSPMEIIRSSGIPVAPTEPRAPSVEQSAEVGQNIANSMAQLLETQTEDESEATTLNDIGNGALLGISKSCEQLVFVTGLPRSTARCTLTIEGQNLDPNEVFYLRDAMFYTHPPSLNFPGPFMNVTGVPGLNCVDTSAQSSNWTGYCTVTAAQITDAGGTLVLNWAASFPNQSLPLRLWNCASLSRNLQPQGNLAAICTDIPIAYEDEITLNQEYLEAVNIPNILTEDGTNPGQGGGQGGAGGGTPVPAPWIDVEKTCEPLVYEAGDQTATATCEITITGGNITSNMNFVMGDALGAPWGQSPPVVSGPFMNIASNHGLLCRNRPTMPNGGDCFFTGAQLNSAPNETLTLTWSADINLSSPPESLVNCATVHLDASFGQGFAVAGPTDNGCDIFPVELAAEDATGVDGVDDFGPPLEPWITVDKTCDPLVYAQGASSATLNCALTVTGGNLSNGDTILLVDRTNYGGMLPVVGSFMNVPQMNGVMCFDAPNMTHHFGRCVLTGDAVTNAGGTLTLPWSAEIGLLDPAQIPATGFQNCVWPMLNGIDAHPPVCAPVPVQTPPPWLTVSKTCDPLVFAPGAQSAQAECDITIAGGGLSPTDTLVFTDQLQSTPYPTIIGTFMNATGASWQNCLDRAVAQPIGDCAFSAAELISAGGQLNLHWSAEISATGLPDELRNCASLGVGVGPDRLHAYDCAVIDIQQPTPPPAPWLTVSKTCDPLVFAPGAQSALAECDITIAGGGLTAANQVLLADIMIWPNSAPMPAVNGTFMNVAGASGMHCSDRSASNAGYIGDCLFTGDQLMANGGQMTLTWTAEILRSPLPQNLQNCAEVNLDFTPASIVQSCVPIPVVQVPIIPTAPNPDGPQSPDGPRNPDDRTELQLELLQIGECRADRERQTYTCGIRAEINNLNDAPYAGPVILTETFGSPGVNSAQLASPGSVRCGGPAGNAVTCSIGESRLAARDVYRVDLSLVVPGRRNGGALDVCGVLGAPASERARVAAVQNLLNQNGYAAGPVDGLPGRQTYAALERLQADRGLPVSRVFDDALMRALGLAPEGAQSCTQLSLPPMPAPPLQCNRATTIARNGACACRYDNMTRRNATSCTCPRGSELVEGRGCVRQQAPVPTPEPSPAPAPAPAPTPRPEPGTGDNPCPNGRMIGGVCVSIAVPGATELLQGLGGRP